MNWRDPCAAGLRDVLADIYYRDPDWDRIVEQSAIPRRLVRLGGSEAPVNIWQAILTAADRRPPALNTILEIVSKEWPKHEPLTAAIAAFQESQMTSAAENRLRVAGNEARSVGDGLDIITRHSDDRLPGAIARWIGDFKIVSAQIDLISGYKELHDLLGALQFLYNMITVQAKRLDDHPDEGETVLPQHELQLERILRKLQGVAARPTLPRENVEWIDTLARAYSQFRRAVDPPDAKAITGALYSIKRVLGIYPSEINTRLNACARVLPLPSLKGAMEGIYRHFEERGLEAEALSRLHAAIENLGRLRNNFDALVGHHDRWQLVDLELRRLGGSVDRDLEEFQASWPDVDGMVQALYESPTEDWVAALNNEAARIGDGLADGAQPRVKHAFHRYQGRCLARFDDVDLSLKQLCGHLREIGDRLSQLVEKLRTPGDAED